MLTYLKMRIVQLQRYLLCELICLIVLIISLGLSFEAVFSVGHTCITFSLLGISVICISMLIMIACFKRSYSKKAKLCAIPIDTISWEQVCTLFSASEILPDAYVSFCKIGSRTTRLLFLYCTRYCKKVISAQRKAANRIINKRYSISSAASLFDAKSRSRVNILVCEKASKDLYQLLETNSKFQIKQSEIVFTVAVALDDNILLMPDCTGEFTLSELIRYSDAVSILTKKFGLDSQIANKLE